MKKLCVIDSKKNPAKKAFDDLGKCIKEKAMPIVIQMNDCGTWVGALCEKGKSKIDQICDDYMFKWFKTPCVSTFITLNFKL